MHVQGNRRTVLPNRKILSQEILYYYFSIYFIFNKRRRIVKKKVCNNKQRENVESLHIIVGVIVFFN